MTEVEQRSSAVMCSAVLLSAEISQSLSGSPDEPQMSPHELVFLLNSSLNLPDTRVHLQPAHVFL